MPNELLEIFSKRLIKLSRVITNVAITDKFDTLRAYYFN